MKNEKGAALVRVLTFLIVLLLILSSFGETQQVTYHRVAPKIFVPFDPNTVKVLYQSDNLFTIEVPMRGIGYAFSPKIAPFGDIIAFIPGVSTFAFTSVFLEPVRVLRIPQDVVSAPAEAKGFSEGGYDNFSFDQQMRLIAFSCDVEVSNPKQAAEREIFIVNSDGTGLRRLTRPLRIDEERGDIARAPAISEDGSFVVYHRRGAGYLGIVKTDGSGLRILVHQTDGLTPVVLTRRAVFYKRGGQVWRASLDGKNQKQLTHEQGEIINPFSGLTADREGTKIAYIVKESGKPNVLKIVDGSTGASLLMLQNVEELVRLSGDGRRLLFSRRVSDKLRLYVMDLFTKKIFEVSEGIRVDKKADFNETGEIVVMIKEEGTPLALAFLPDETPPFLTVEAPKEGATISGESVNVVVKYHDRAVVSGVDPESLRVFINGVDVSSQFEKGVDQAMGRLDRQVLRKGKNVLEVEVADRAGNKTKRKCVFSVEL
ncbi:MAG: hypothetical protein ACK4GR_01195 [bacterium]